MIDRRRRNELVRKFVAMVALVGCLGIGVAIIGSLWTQIFSGGPKPATRAQSSVTTRTSTPPPEVIRPLQLRPVQEVRSPDQCPLKRRSLR
jgi:hypothetical protein